MSETNTIGIGILGVGTVGSGVIEGLRSNAVLLRHRLGASLEVKRASVRDLSRDRGVDLADGVLTDDNHAVIDDPAVDIVVELIGGETLARELVLKALQAGKPVVTANKALLAAHGSELFAAAAAAGTDLYFEASVGGAIPIIRALREGLVGNRINGMVGILNGTCNYILTRMEKEKQPFDVILEDAVKNGFAEADPSLDVDGHDAAHKSFILAQLAYGDGIRYEDVYVEGISDLKMIDFEYAADLGYRIKLLCIMRNVDNHVDVRVHPALVPLSHMLASVSGSNNAVLVDSDMAGDTLYYGPGAGKLPTASAVISDITDVARNLTFNSPCRLAPGKNSGNGDTMTALDPDKAITRYYLRLQMLDVPGSLARVSHVLGEHGLSIASLLQKENLEGEYVDVVVVTHQAEEGAFRQAFEAMSSMKEVGGNSVRLRIEDFGDDR